MTGTGRPDLVYLHRYLSPLVGVLARPDVTDIYVNKPGELWIEALGGAIERIEAPTLTMTSLDRLSRQIAALNHQGINRAHPLLSASLPDGARIQIIAPPATRGDLALAIRKHVSSDLSLDTYMALGTFEHTRSGADDQRLVTISAISKLIEEGRYADALRFAVKTRLNILVAGGTSTGKTTFLNALIREIPANERLIFIEDTPEIQFEHPNAVGLIASRSALGEALVSSEDLLNASLRMRPDRIILGELRGTEAFSFLRAVNTGHPGSVTTVHADTPERAIEQIALLVLQSGTRLRREDIVQYVRSTVDLYVQLERRGGQRLVTGVTLARDLANAIPEQRAELGSLM